MTMQIACHCGGKDEKCPDCGGTGVIVLVAQDDDDDDDDDEEEERMVWLYELARTLCTGDGVTDNATKTAGSL